MLYLQGAVSSKPWEPIFNVRIRPPWVQTTVFDLLKQLKVLRSVTATLPSIDTIRLPSHRQLGVSFGDMDALCDSIEFIFDSCGALGVSYGGPDDRGTLWIKFYKKLAEDRSPNNQLQFIIWINSVRGPSIALEEGVKSVYEQMAGPTRALETCLRNYRWQVPMTQMRRTPTKAPWRLGEGYAVEENLRQMKKIERPKASCINQSISKHGREFPDTTMEGLRQGQDLRLNTLL